MHIAKQKGCWYNAVNRQGRIVMRYSRRDDLLGQIDFDLKARTKEQAHDHALFSLCPLLYKKGYSW